MVEEIERLRTCMEVFDKEKTFPAQSNVCGAYLHCLHLKDKKLVDEAKELYRPYNEWVKNGRGIEEWTEPTETKNSSLEAFLN